MLRGVRLYFAGMDLKLDKMTCKSVREEDKIYTRCGIFYREFCITGCSWLDVLFCISISYISLIVKSITLLRSEAQTHTLE